MAALATAFTAQTAQAEDAPVTAVVGESWLNHIQRAFNETGMGNTWRLGPVRVPSGENRFRSLDESSDTPQAVTLYGADLYRLNCRGCHGEFGLGAPPEINSVINPVRSTSVTAIIDRMKNVGVDISRAQAAELAKQSKAALLQRLQNGGQNMPPFPHLDEAEVAALYAYLKQLAGIPGAEKEQAAVRESPVRVGEHLVKSTCHICHSAVGENPTPQQLLDGAIPPLSTLTARVSRTEFVRKVTSGAPILMGTPPMQCRGRMPVFYYLSENEAAEVYLYLSRYPPHQEGLETAGSEPAEDFIDESTEGLVPSRNQSREGDPRSAVSLSEVANVGILFYRLVAISSAIILLAGAVGFTLFEFRRLTPQNEARRLEKQCLDDESFPGAQHGSNTSMPDTDAAA